MYEDILSQAVLPAPVQVLGLALKPYSLGHELWLIRQDNPLAILFGNSKPIPAASLLEAALICEHTFDENREMNSSLWETFKIPHWAKRAAKKFNAFSELEKFQKYRDECLVEFPCQSPAKSSDSAPSRYLGAPFLIRVHSFLVSQFHLTSSQAWDEPFGFAKMRYAAWMEDNRRMEIKNESDLAVDAEREKWMKEHPDDGIEILSKEDECQAS